jgi:HAD superfamily hydrolase (TIGR01509 family)
VAELLSSRPVRAILFDLDGTLRHNIPSSNHTFFDYAVALGAADSPENRRRTIRWVHYYWAQSPELMGDLQVFGSLSPEFWAFYAERSLVVFGCPEAQAKQLAPQVARRMDDEYAPLDHVPPEVHQTMRALKAAGLRLAVVSNRGNAFDEQLTTLELSQYFEFAVAAGVLDLWKPEAAIFLHAVELLGVRPEETIYVGDNYFADVIGARNAGLQPVLIDPEGVFTDALDLIGDCPVIRDMCELLPLLQLTPL